MKIVIFGGTTEGRLAANEHMAQGDDVLVCVTSDYARQLLPQAVRCLAHPMAENEVLDMLRAEAPDTIIDATHPFAASVTEIVSRCAAALGLKYQRIARPAGEKDGWTRDVEWVCDTDAAVEALKRTSGNILLTTGSRTLASYTGAISHERLFVRVLPTLSAITACGELPPGHVIAMQGPFSRALNAAIYDQLNIRVMVSKDSGEAGGVSDKVIPALERDVHVIMINRPKEKV